MLAVTAGSGQGTGTAQNGIMGTSLQYNGYWGAEDSESCNHNPSAADIPNGSATFDASTKWCPVSYGVTDDKTPLVAGAKKLSVEADGQSVTGTDVTPDPTDSVPNSENDIPESDNGGADAIAKGAGYVPAIYGVTPASPASKVPTNGGTADQIAGDETTTAVEKSQAFRHYVTINYGNVLRLSDWETENFAEGLCVSGQGCKGAAGTTDDTKANKQVNAWIVNDKPGESTTDDAQKAYEEGWAY
jgi:hypothetical protein